MRAVLGAPFAALLLLTGCGGRAAAPIASSPAERIPPAQATTATEGRGSGSHDTRARDAGGRGPRAAGPRDGTMARDDAGIAEEDIAGTRADDTGGDTEDTDEPADRPGDAAGDASADEAVYHILRSGQTLYSVARMYHVDLAAMMDANGITDPTKVPADTPILIPGYRRGRAGGVAPDDAAVHLAWPLHGAITGPFGPRGRHSHHAGIDIDGQKGDPILAAASGVVLKAGVDGRYGRRVVVDHGDGLLTLYAHASRLLVHEGDQVRAGEEIAEVGRSGNARGTHLHFEVRREGRAVNPLPYLKTGDLVAGISGAGLHPASARGTPRAKPPGRPASAARRSSSSR